MKNLRFRTLPGTITIIFLAAAATFLSLWAMGSGPASTAYAASSVPPQGLEQAYKEPMAPLDSLLNEDGTLDLQSGFTGSADPTGWQMVSEPGAPPRFIKDNEAREQFTSKGIEAPLAPGDEKWDGRFFAPGVTSTVYAIAVSGSDVYVGG